MTKRELTFEEMKKPGKRLINRKQLLQIVPLSERTIYDLEQRGEFPKRFAITSRMVAWDLQEVEKWMDEKKAAGVTPEAPGLKAAA